VLALTLLFSQTLIRMGARFTPCIRTIPTYTTNSTAPYLPACPLGIPAPCTIPSVCGLDGTSDQWYRFVMAIFLHGGVVHLLFNLLFQLRVGAAMEKDFGSFRIAAIYLLSGVAGFVFGANINYMLPSVGCSGALFGLVACLLLDLLQNWKLIVRPWWELVKLVVVILLSFGLGLLPYVDNFAQLVSSSTRASRLASLTFDSFKASADSSSVSSPASSSSPPSPLGNGTDGGNGFWWRSRSHVWLRRTLGCFGCFTMGRIAIVGGAGGFLGSGECESGVVDE